MTDFQERVKRYIDRVGPVIPHAVVCRADGAVELKRRVQFGWSAQDWARQVARAFAYTDMQVEVTARETQGFFVATVTEVQK